MEVKVFGYKEPVHIFCYEESSITNTACHFMNKYKIALLLKNMMLPVISRDLILYNYWVYG